MCFGLGESEWVLWNPYFPRIKPSMSMGLIGGPRLNPEPMHT